MADKGQRGKWSEKEVKDWMTKRSDAEAGFWFYRYPDPRAGSLQAVPADFGVLHQRTPFLVEVKEVQITAASRRLPAKNFSADKVARMNKFALAGGGSWVLICHVLKEEGKSRPTTQEWRLVPIGLFVSNRPASWDVQSYFSYGSAHEAMLALFGYPAKPVVS